MKAIISFLVFVGMVLLYNGAHAQDVIYMNDGRKIEGKVTKVDDNIVKYIKADDPNNYEKTLGKINVSIILYENGTHEVMKREETLAKKLKKDFGRHLINWDGLDIFALNVSFAYEYFSKSGKIGVRVPLSLGFKNTWAEERFQVIGQHGRIFATGIDINYYPAGQGTGAYFLGPSFGYSTIRYYPQENYYSPMKFVEQYALHFVQGVVLQMGKRVALSGAVGIGILQKHSPVNDWEWKQTQSITLRGSIGYRFGYTKE